MPLIAMKEIMTPLKLIGIKIFKSSTKSIILNSGIVLEKSYLVNVKMEYLKRSG